MVRVGPHSQVFVSTSKLYLVYNSLFVVVIWIEIATYTIFKCGSYDLSECVWIKENWWKRKGRKILI